MSRKDKRALETCERGMENAKTYADWLAAAAEFDHVTGLERWRAEEESPLYDHHLIRSRLNELRRLRAENDIDRLAFALHEGLHGNLGNMANPALYGYCLAGTKTLIGDYVDCVADALQQICDADDEQMPLGEKIRFFKRTGRSFGRSALMLSGGATLGMFHLGVIKAFWDEGLLPRVLSGSSAGSLVGAVACTHKDDELEQMFEPSYMALQAWRAMGIKGTMKARALMDGDQLEQAITTHIGDMTFEEAFEKTGRILNVTVSPTAAHQQPRLLNYLTAPNVYVRRAARASCAVPGLFSPAELQCKGFEGKPEPYMADSLWCDGSLRSDLPMLRLARQHNVNHYIVSQTNPHVLPFMSRRRTRSGFIAVTRRALGSGAKIYLDHVIDMTRNNLSSYGAALMMDKALSIANQKYSGDISIFAQHKTKFWMRLIANPTEDDIADYITNGERASWPSLERVRTQTRISTAFDSCLEQLKARAGGDERYVPVKKRSLLSGMMKR